MGETSYYTYDSKKGCPVAAFFEGPHVPSVAAFGTLARLPRELIEHILSLACRLPEKGAINLSQRSALALDVPTTLSISLVSKAMGIWARLILWSCPRLTRPSALLEICRSLQKHSCWGKLIWDLHIGGSVTLPSSEWPLDIVDKEDGIPLQFPGLRIKSSFSSSEQAKLPRWCEPGRSWSLDPAKLDCADTAVSEALKVAMEAIDFEPYRRCWGKSGELIGLERWATRLYELQAILDLYLIEMRRIEDAKGYKILPWRFKGNGPPQAPAICRLAKCSHYPRLVLTGWDVQEVDGEIFPAYAPKPEKGTFTITRAQVWSHLTRRGSALDQFDHPILFARCGFDSAPLSDDAREFLGKFLIGPHPDHFSCGEYHPEPHDHNNVVDTSEEKDRLYEERVIKALKLAPRNTMPKLMVAASEVIDRAEGLRNLSINGTLDLCLYHDMEAWTNLRSASIGPLLPISKGEGIRFAERKAKFDELENLRICGVSLEEDDADRLAGKGSAFPKLKRLQWEWVQPLQPATRPDLSDKDLLRIVTRLQRQHKEPLNDEQEPPASRLIEVRLHPSDCFAILKLAPPLQRTSLTTGERQQGYANRVRLTESKASQFPIKSEAAQQLHEHSQLWWDDCTASPLKRERKRGEDWMPGREGGEAVQLDRAQGGGTIFVGGGGGAGEREEGGFGSGFRSGMRLDVGEGTEE